MKEVYPENGFFLLLAGTRTYNDYDTFSCIVNKMCVNQKDKTIIIVSGGAKKQMDLKQK